MSHSLGEENPNCPELRKLPAQPHTHNLILTGPVCFARKLLSLSPSCWLWLHVLLLLLGQHPFLWVMPPFGSAWNSTSQRIPLLKQPRAIWMLFWSFDSACCPARMRIQLPPLPSESQSSILILPGSWLPTTTTAPLVFSQPPPYPWVSVGQFDFSLMFSPQKLLLQKKQTTTKIQKTTDLFLGRFFIFLFLMYHSGKTTHVFIFNFFLCYLSF